MFKQSAIWSSAVPIAGGSCWLLEREEAAAEARLIEALLSPSADVVETFKESARNLVQRIDYQGRSWVVKRYRGQPWKIFAYHLVHKTGAWREWGHAVALHRLGVRVIQPIALVHVERFGRWQQVLIMPYIDGPSLHHWVKQSEHGRLTRLVVAQAVGRQTGQISRGGYINRDHKASNLIIDGDCEGGASPVLIDPARITRRGSIDEVILMAARLLGSLRRAGPVTVGERLAGLRAMVQADASLGSGLRSLAGAIEKMEARL